MRALIGAVLIALMVSETVCGAGETPWCWGRNQHGQVGNNTTIDQRRPITVVGLSDVIKFDGGVEHSIALKADGTVWGWGKGGNGQIGSSGVDKHVPFAVQGMPSGIQDVTAGGNNSLAVDSSGALWACGENFHGALGTGGSTPTWLWTAAQISGVSGVAAVAGGLEHSLLLLTNGTVQSSGYNFRGQLGDGTITDRNMFVTIPGLSNIVAIEAGHYHSMAIDADGTLWGWGNATYGLLGEGSQLSYYTSPTPIPGMTNIAAVACGVFHTLYLKDDGTVWQSGYVYHDNWNGGPSAVYHTPVQVAGLTNVIAIAAGGGYYGDMGVLSLAIQEDGTAWSWGWNGYGQLGDGSITPRDSAEQIIGIENATVVGASSYHSFVMGTFGEILPPPVGVIASDGIFTNKVTIDWQPASGATGYNLWRNTSSSTSGAIRVGTGLVTTNYNDTTADPGVPYHYWVEAYTPSVTSDWSVSDQGYRGLVAPTGVAATDGQYSDKIVISWMPSPGAVSYDIHRNWSNDFATSFLWADSWAATNVQDLVPTLGQIAFYWVKANGLIGQSPHSLPDSGYRFFAAPTGLSASDGTSTSAIELTWNFVSGAVGYEVWRNTTNHPATATRIASPSALSYSDASAVHGEEYTFWVKSRSSGGTSGFSAVDTGYRAFPGPTRVIASDATFTDRVAIAWSSPAEPGVTEYTVWRNLVDDTSSASSVATVSLTTVDDTTAVPGSKYYYWVAAGNSTGPGFFSLPDTGSCGPVPDSALFACGINQYGQTGSGDFTPVWFNEPTPLVDGTGVMTMHCGSFHTLAIRSNGTLWACGRNTWGQLGNGTTTNAPALIPVPGQTSVVSAGGGLAHTVVAHSNGTVWAWGNGTQGQLGVNAFTEYHAPVQSFNITDATAVAAGEYFSLAVAADGSLWAWGANPYGQLGNDSTTNSYVPIKVPGLTGVTAVAAGDSHVLAILQDGTVRAWGRNDSGQLGDNSTTDRHTPVAVDGLSNVVAVAAGAIHSLAVDSLGQVWSWGGNDNGQLGNGTTGPRLTAGLADVPSDAFAIAAAGRFSLAILNDGTCWSWGDNYYGQLGDGSYEDRHQPVAVHVVSMARNAAAGILHSLFLVGATHDLALDTDGDGLSDGEELAAGTNPYSAADVFETDAIAATGGVATITWNGKKGKTYEVHRSPDLSGWGLAPSSDGPNQQSIQTATQNWIMMYSDPAPIPEKAYYRLILDE